MISKRDLIARNPNHYNLTQKQLDELEVTKAQVAEHLRNVDFSQHDQRRRAPTNNSELEHQAKRFLEFSHLINPKTRRK
jgi:hypothetical protein